MDSTAIAALFAFLTVLVQVVANQWGAQKAREHELTLKRLQMEAEDDDDHKQHEVIELPGGDKE